MSGGMSSEERRERTLRRLASANRSFSLDEMAFAGIVSLATMAQHGLVTISIRLTPDGFAELEKVEAKKHRLKIQRKRLEAA